MSSTSRHSQAPTAATPGTGQPNARERLVWGAGLLLPMWMLWLSLNGLAHWAEGLAAATVAAIAGAWLAPGKPYRWRPLRLLSFSGYFLWSALRGGIDVAARALRPAMPLNPAWVQFQVWLPHGQPRTLLLSVTSLLPGTLAAEIDPQTSVMHVHVLAQGVDPGLEDLQSRLGQLFDLEAPTP